MSFSPAKVLHSLTRRAGRRGAFLLFLTVLDLAYGWSLLSEPPGQFRLIDSFLPVQVWAAAWLAVGVICAIHAFRSHDRLAFSAAAGLKTIWAAIFAEGWLIHHLYRGWISVVVWAAFAATILVIASWPEVGGTG